MKPSQPRCAASWRRKTSDLADALLEARVQKCEQIIGYTFKNRALIREALVHQRATNQRLALAGDKAADLVLAAHWYRTRHSETGHLAPRQWAGLKNDLLSNANLANVGQRLRILGASHIHSGPARATTVEAVMGAVWLDSDHGPAAALESVMRTFGLLTHPLLLSPTTARPTLDGSATWSHQHLPARFFNGRHPACHPARHSLPGLWSRLKSLLFTSKSTVDTAHEHHGLEQHASAAVPSTNKQTATPYPGPEPDSTLPAPNSVVQSGRAPTADSPAGRGGTFTGWYSWDTEWARVNSFIVAVANDPSNLDKRLLPLLRHHPQMKIATKSWHSKLNF
ncbi:hypothetical protein KVR01_013060 [Diaporthe batatas]|uniref:uncharacterized protein n=1 Tax=Diaporthe batatas TaxID=748121 RepID=UPI001D05565E|nr:uncharacterized protein KVR01_013060 [Diaporthe batatas]KAG8157070.1 hypothetical protein KVR01_013060 [Diaporthe batatas]